MLRRPVIASLILAAIGLASLVGIDDPEPVRVALYLVPYAAAVGLTAWGRRQRTWAAAPGLVGLGLMAAVSWLEHTGRVGPSFEWRFSNALQFATACGANYLLLAVTAVCTLLAAGEEPDLPPSPPVPPPDA